MHENHEVETPHYWKYKSSNAVPRIIFQPRKSTIVAISHYLKSPNCNVVYIPKINFVLAFYQFYKFDVFGTKNIYIVCL